MKKTQRSSNNRRDGEQAGVAAGEPLAAKLQGGKVGICLTADERGYRRSERGAEAKRAES